MIITPLMMLFAQQMTPLPPSADPALALGPISQPPMMQVQAQPQGILAAAGSIDSDDFNRTALGPDWTDMSGGGFAIAANTLTSSTGNHYMHRTGLAVPYADATTEFDLLPNPTGLTYTGAITGDYGADRLWTKIQSNAGGLHDHIGFYHLNGTASGLLTYGGFFAITPVNGGRVRMYVTNGGDTMNIDIDEGHDGTFEYHYESSGILAEWPGGLGTGTGMCAWAASADNWALGDGGPSLTITGACPGPVTIDVAGMTPAGSVAMAYGPAGVFVIPSGPCAGTVIDIGVPTLAGFFVADASGAISISTTLPGAVCGLTVQAVDMTTCAVSNTITL